MDAEESHSPFEPQTAPGGWEKMFGILAGSEGLEKAVRLGLEWREAQNAEDEALMPSNPIP